MSVGRGLFTLAARKKDEFIVAFPGYWMESKVFGKRTQHDDRYAFSVPPGEEWASLADLVYVTHGCQANYINAARAGTEVMHFTLRIVRGLALQRQAQRVVVLVKCPNIGSFTAVLCLTGHFRAECALRFRKGEPPCHGQG